MPIKPTGSPHITPPPVPPKPTGKTGDNGPLIPVKNVKPTLPKKTAGNSAPTTTLQNRQITSTERKSDYEDVKNKCLDYAENNCSADKMIAKLIEGISNRSFLEDLLKEVEYIDTYGGATDAIQDAITKLDQESPEQKATTKLKRRPAQRGRSPDNTSGQSAKDTLTASFQTISNMEKHGLKPHISDDQKVRLNSLKQNLATLLKESSTHGESQEVSERVDQLSVEIAGLQRELFQAQRGTEATIPKAETESLSKSFQSLTPKDQIKALKKAKNQEQAGELLDQCTAEQLEQLSNDKEFPEKFWPVMNRRLLKDKIDTYSDNETTGLWRVPGNKRIINNAHNDFNKKRVSNEILENPNDSIGLFKKINNSDGFINENTFKKLAKAISKNPSDMTTFDKILIKEKAAMSPDNRDLFKVTISIMRNLYKNAPNDSKQGERVAKSDLIRFFGELIFKYPESKDLKKVTEFQNNGIKMLKVILKLS